MACWRALGALVGLRLAEALAALAELRGTALGGVEV